MENTRNVDVPLLCKEIKIERKQFTITFKENPLTQFMILSSTTTNTPHYSLYLSSSTIPLFLDSFDASIASFHRVGFCKELSVDDKLYRFLIGENYWGRFLKVSEASDRIANYIIIPSGNSQEQNDGWVSFRNAISEIYENAKFLFPPRQSMSTLSLENTEELKADHPRNENVFQRLKTEQSSLFFDCCSSRTGPYLKISEDGRRNCYVRIPMADLRQFHEMIGQFLENPANENSSTTENLEQSISNDLKFSNMLQAGGCQLEYLQALKDHSSRLLQLLMHHGFHSRRNEYGTQRRGVQTEHYLDWNSSDDDVEIKLGNREEKTIIILN
ncbi:hypothetical protein ACFE04_023781 [Oxalis oulophora]